MTRDAYLESRMKFLEAVLAKAEVGYAEYGDRSYGREPSNLIGEIQEEIVDIAGWGAIAWCKLERLREKAAELEADIEKMKKRLRSRLSHGNGLDIDNPSP